MASAMAIPMIQSINKVLVLAMLYAIPAQSVSLTEIQVDSAGPVSPWGKSTGDIDSDGDPDLLVGGNDSGGLVWYENPSWTKHSVSPDTGFSTDHEIADMDGDGDQDIIALNSSDGMKIYFQDGPTWTPFSVTSLILHDVEVSDLDQDGDFDLVTRNQNNDTAVYIFEQVNPGSYNLYTIQAQVGEGLIVYDIDEDGRDDIIINNQWLENTGTISSWNSHTYTTTWSVSNTFIGIGDINGDGRTDIVLTPSEAAGEFAHNAWFEAPIDRTGLWSEHIIETSVERVLHSLRVADFDLDGDMDIATGEMAQGSDPDEGYLLINEDGAGTTWSKEVFTTLGTHSFRAFDMDNDGDEEIFGANFNGNAPVKLFVNNTAPAVPYATDQWQRYIIDSTAQINAAFVYPADIDGDGMKDIVSGPYWYKNPGPPISQNWSRFAIGTGLNDASAVYDFDKDGDIDVLGTTAVENSADFVWGENDGAGNFSIHANIQSGQGDFLQGVKVAHIVPGGNGQVVLSWHNLTTTQMLTVPADPTTDIWAWSVLSSTTNGEQVAVADLDRDGDLDIHLGENWLRNDGANWSSHPAVSVGAGNTDRLELTDVDGDGDLDAVIGVENGTRLLWGENPGQLASNPDQPWAEHLISTATRFYSVDTADVDRDGDPDIVAGEHLGDGKVFLFLNDGTGSSWALQMIDDGLSGLDHHIGTRFVDLDLDQDLDIISIGYTSQKLVIYENQAVSPTSIRAAVPQLNPPGGYFANSVTVAMNTSTPNAQIFYTLDGSDPTQGSLLYSAPINLAQTATIKARTFDPSQSLQPSNIAVGIYTHVGMGDADLTAYWSFDDGNTTVAADITGNGFNGTLVGAGPSTDIPQNVLPGGKSLSFSNSRIELPAELDISGSEMTIVAWVKARSFTGQDWDGRILAKTTGTDSQDHYWMLSTIDSGGAKLRFRLKTAGETSTLIGNSPLLTDIWTHVAAVYDGAEMKVYVDGVLDGSQGKSGALSTNPQVPVAIGDNSTGGVPWDGNIDEVAIYSTALSDAEIQDIYQNGISLDRLPVVSITSPLEGDIFTDTDSVLIAASATGTNASIAEVRFYEDGNLIQSDTDFPYEINTTFVAGSHTLTAESVDNLGAKTLSSAVNISVEAPSTLSLTLGLAPHISILNQPYWWQGLTASGGAPPYSWEIVSGSIPLPMTLDPVGVISGIPTNAGTTLFQIRVTDSNSDSVTTDWMWITVRTPVYVCGSCHSDDRL